MTSFIPNLKINLQIKYGGKGKRTLSISDWKTYTSFCPRVALNFSGHSRPLAKLPVQQPWTGAWDIC